jgi:aryl-alcohol dehydrogenase-like predicted oxidoreductase
MTIARETLVDPLSGAASEINKVPNIQLGGLAFGNHYGRLDRSVVLRTIRAAFDAGIGFFDTSPSFGNGLAEELLGEALVSTNGEIKIATKTPLMSEALWFDSSQKRACVAAELEASLRRLRREYIDLYYVDGIDSPGFAAEVVQALEGFRATGVIRSIGLRTSKLEVLRSALSRARVDAVQAPYNLFNRVVESELLPFCLTNTIAFHACEPFCRGLLIGHLHKNSVFDEHDLRIEDLRFRGERFRRNIEIVNRLHAFADQERISLPQLVCGWLMTTRAVSTVICGVRSPQQAREIAGTYSVRLAPEQVLEINLIVGEDRYQQPA